MRRLALAAAALGCCAATSASSPVASLAGRYYRQFPDVMMDGEKYLGENVVEIVPVASHAAYVRVHLDYANGHICSIWGVAEADGPGLVYRDPSRPAPGQPPCTLTIARVGGSLRLDDGPDQSCQKDCGARGTLSDVRLPLASKRPIRYMDKIKASSNYRKALTEWHTGKPVNP